MQRLFPTDYQRRRIHSFQKDPPLGPEAAEHCSRGPSQRAEHRFGQRGRRSLVRLERKKIEFAVELEPEQQHHKHRATQDHRLWSGQGARLVRGSNSNYYVRYT